MTAGKRTAMSENKMFREYEEQCIHCGKCVEKCDFLRKYGYDLGEPEKLADLAYHCFLCGSCDNVCPAGLSGTALFAEMRKNAVRDGSGCYDAGTYKGLLAEKKNYKFSNYRNATSGTVLFPGCNFPALFPKTNAKIVRLFKSEYGIGVVYDCCGKPIAELGLESDEERIISRIDDELRKHGIFEIVTMCPNCFCFLKKRLSCKVTGIYDKIEELGIEIRKPEGVRLFPPCPDRYEKTWLETISHLIGYRPEEIDAVQCCGLGGCASAKEKAVADGFCDRIVKEGQGGMSVYCASCAGRFAGNGATDTRHILSMMLGVDEEPSVKTSFINRALTKVK